nr:MAG TPA: hypothetical protein [Caudoviricetes sp.]
MILFSLLSPFTKFYASFTHLAFFIVYFSIYYDIILLKNRRNYHEKYY